MYIIIYRYEYVQVNILPALWLREPDEVVDEEEYSSFWHSFTLNYYKEPHGYTHFHQTQDVDFRG
jgi:HSP90 family molecular chaperone